MRNIFTYIVNQDTLTFWHALILQVCVQTTESPRHIHELHVPFSNFWPIWKTITEHDIWVIDQTQVKITRYYPKSFSVEVHKYARKICFVWTRLTKSHGLLAWPIKDYQFTKRRKEHHFLAETAGVPVPAGKPQFTKSSNQWWPRMWLILPSRSVPRNKRNDFSHLVNWRSQSS